MYLSSELVRASNSLLVIVEVVEVVLRLVAYSLHVPHYLQLHSWHISSGRMTWQLLKFASLFAIAF